MSKVIKNYTFSLPIDLLNKLKKYSNEGLVPSVNSAVKDAIESYVKLIEKQNLYIQMKEASKDPMFMEDLDSVMHDFSYSDFEATKENK
ncbi:MAG: hypothetical protein AB1420_17500 [Bacillota bacterium]